MRPRVHACGHKLHHTPRVCVKWPARQARPERPPGLDAVVADAGPLLQRRGERHVRQVVPVEADGVDLLPDLLQMGGDDHDVARGEPDQDVPVPEPLVRHNVGPRGFPRGSWWFPSVLHHFQLPDQSCCQSAHMRACHWNANLLNTTLGTGLGSKISAFLPSDGELPPPLRESHKHGNCGCKPTHPG